MGKKSTKTTTSNEPPKWAKPYLTGAASTIQNTVANNQGNLDQLAGNIRGFLPGLGEKAFGEQPGLNAATGYATDVLGGKYLDEGNPYLQGMIDSTNSDVSDRVNAMFNKSGSALGTRHAGVLTKELANAENGLRYTNYGNERNAMTQAAGMMPGLNSAQYAGVAPYLAAAQTAGGLPYQGIGNLGMIGGLFGGYGTQTGSQPGGWGTQLASAAATALPFLLSDRRSKTNIERIGEWDGKGDGLGKYRFAYKIDPATMFEGVMADEVADKRPWALGPTMPNGYATVNYAKLSEAA